MRAKNRWLIGIIAIGTMAGVLWAIAFRSSQEPTGAASNAPHHPIEVTQIGMGEAGPSNVPGPAPGDNREPLQAPEFVREIVGESAVADFNAEVATLLTDDTIGTEEAGKRLASLAAQSKNASNLQREDALDHALNLLEDADFPSSILPLLQQDSVTEDMREAVYHDLLNRPDEVKLPMLVDLAETKPSSETAAEAIEILEFYLETNHGGNWPAWRSGVESYLQEQN